MQRAHTRNICFPGYFSAASAGSNLIVSGPAQGYVCATRVNGGLHACSNRLRLPRVRLEHLLLRWIHSVLIGAEAEQCLLRAWRARSSGNSPGTEYIALGSGGMIRNSTHLNSHEIFLNRTTTPPERREKADPLPR